MNGEARPFSKEQQLARGERRHHRRIASKGTWQRIMDAKNGPCRCCHTDGPVELHHIVPRGIGGSDVEENIAPLCHVCHQMITERDPRFCILFRANMTDQEVAYATVTLGDARFDARYPAA